MAKIQRSQAPAAPKTRAPLKTKNTDDDAVSSSKKKGATKTSPSTKLSPTLSPSEKIVDISWYDFGEDGEGTTSTPATSSSAGKKKTQPQQQPAASTKGRKQAATTAPSASKSKTTSPAPRTSAPAVSQSPYDFDEGLDAEEPQAQKGARKSAGKNGTKAAALSSSSTATAKKAAATESKKTGASASALAPAARRGGRKGAAVEVHVLEEDGRDEMEMDMGDHEDETAMDMGTRPSRAAAPSSAQRPKSALSSSSSGTPSFMRSSKPKLSVSFSPEVLTSTPLMDDGVAAAGDARRAEALALGLDSSGLGGAGLDDYGMGDEDDPFGFDREPEAPHPALHAQQHNDAVDEEEEDVPSTRFTPSISPRTRASTSHSSPDSPASLSLAVSPLGTTETTTRDKMKKGARQTDREQKKEDESAKEEEKEEKEEEEEDAMVEESGPRRGRSRAVSAAAKRKSSDSANKETKPPAAAAAAASSVTSTSRSAPATKKARSARDAYEFDEPEESSRPESATASPAKKSKGTGTGARKAQHFGKKTGQHKHEDEEKWEEILRKQREEFESLKDFHVKGL